MNNNYIKLINLTKNNILKLTKQLKFLNYIDNQIVLLNLNQFGGGLETQIKNINEQMGNEVKLLRERLETLDQRLKDYEVSKQQNLIEKINKYKEIEKLNRNFELYNRKKIIIENQIEKLKNDGHDIFDPGFKDLLMKELVIRAFKIKGKEKLIKRRYNFVDFLIRKYYLSTLTEEDSDKYTFLSFVRPKEIMEMIQDTQTLSHEDLTKFQKAVLKKEITKDQNSKREFAISETKKMLQLQFNDKEYNELKGVMDKRNSELNEKDEEIIDKFYIIE
jgi:hypothetical protein